VKSLGRIIISAFVMGILCLTFACTSFAATKTSDSEYKPKNVKINYQEYKQDDGGEKKKVANVLVTWEDTSKTSKKVVIVTFNDTEIVNEEVDVSVHSYDIREEVLKHGAGKYIAYVYSAKTGNTAIKNKTVDNKYIFENFILQIAVFSISNFIVYLMVTFPRNQEG